MNRGFSFKNNANNIMRQRLGEKNVQDQKNSLKMDINSGLDGPIATGMQALIVKIGKIFLGSVIVPKDQYNKNYSVYSGKDGNFQNVFRVMCMDVMGATKNYHDILGLEVNKKANKNKHYAVRITIDNKQEIISRYNEFLNRLNIETKSEIFNCVKLDMVAGNNSNKQNNSAKNVIGDKFGYLSTFRGWNLHLDKYDSRYKIRNNTADDEYLAICFCKKKMIQRKDFFKKVDYVQGTLVYQIRSRKGSYIRAKKATVKILGYNDKVLMSKSIDFSFEKFISSGLEFDFPIGDNSLNYLRWSLTINRGTLKKDDINYGDIYIY